MASLARFAKTVGALGVTSVLLGSAVACSGGPASAGPTSPTPGAISTSPPPTVAVTISPAHIQASLNNPTRPDGRYLIDPLVTFSAAGTNAAIVKDLRVTFVVDTDRVIKQGALLVHGGDLLRGPVTQRYPLTFDVPVHFPDLRIQMTARFVDGSGLEMTTEPAEASIQLPGAPR